MSDTCVALLPAAGSGSRMAAQQPKQYLPLAGRPLIWHTLQALHAVPELSRIAVVLAPDDREWDHYDWSGFHRLTVLRVGGETRAATVRNGLRALWPDYLPGEPDAAVPPRPSERIAVRLAVQCDATPGPLRPTAGAPWVLVHDAARPCLDPALVSAMIATLRHDAVGGILALPVADTLKAAAHGTRIAHTHPRDGLWQAQTPQMFRLDVLAGALEATLGPEITDEASALERLGLSPALVHGSPWNLKVTYPQDLQLAELILAARAR
ncbi:2-C-methyl-D-erythritol 4-phosphate cytidylyltransferase [Chitiniphilus purpureus]|uniref:2-C-methyl-D-erythritol 4-phosphate cytidylyltransferase n=1 Tax=Chitiniphilus purpureus TaxID=2981137 RepID=A0ABY6DJF4_9NEIS|nr:2-C-methyl-D-erythritol 4-phosphate cytidylyltransferase [Chitiniphilus sp. CD1]UXY14491.1 2-C-methyl-D-erythritol 4-phosphate cytidylyltransferase [Chitiniphilus sp. CD1]